MPIIGGKYISPDWANDQAPPINAQNMEDLCGTVEKLDAADNQPQHTTQTATLPVAGWSNNQQTVPVTGVTANNTVIVSPAPASVTAYGNAGIYASAQGAGTITFTYSTTPTEAISVNVAIFD